jgi:hypothetical protein
LRLNAKQGASSLKDSQEKRKESDSFFLTMIKS